MPCRQVYFESVRGTSTWQVQDRGKMELETNKINRKKHLAPQKTTKKPKKQFGNRIGEMWIIFLYLSFSHPRHHHPAEEERDN